MDGQQIASIRDFYHSLPEKKMLKVVFNMGAYGQWMADEYLMDGICQVIRWTYSILFFFSYVLFFLIHTHHTHIYCIHTGSHMHKLTRYIITYICTYLTWYVIHSYHFPLFSLFLTGEYSSLCHAENKARWDQKCKLQVRLRSKQDPNCLKKIIIWITSWITDWKPSEGWW